ncbi:MAG: glycosyltransferase family 4 protein [Thermodesulfobacteriota bacterium]
MRILLIHQAFASGNEPGGTRHYELARHLQRAGHTFTIVTSDINYQTGQSVVTRRGLFSCQILDDGIQVLRVYTYSALHRSYVWRVFSFLSFMATSLWVGLRAGPVDLVMGTSPPIFQAISAWLVARLRGKPFLLEIRDLWPEFAIDVGILNNPTLIVLSRWLERFLYAHADHILVNSPAYRAYMLAREIPSEKVSLISNGVDPDIFDPQDDGAALRSAWRLTGRFLVTYAGALGLANDIPTILRAAARLRERPDIHFLLVGDGKERRTLEAQAQGLGLNNLTFTGSYPKMQMPAVLAASDACIAILKDIPMFRTTYPNKVFDYMAAGRPTVLAIDGVIRQVIEAAQGGIFVPPGDDAALAAAVCRLADNPAQARAMGLAARSYVVKHFCRRDQAEAFTRLVVRLSERK